MKELLTNNFKGKNPDIIMLCETWQSKNNPIPIFEGYQVVQKYREHRKGGGVAILVSENLNYKRRPDLESNTNVLEYCAIEVKLARENVICCSCYRAPNTDVKIFQTEYESLLDRLKPCKSKIIMGMDHNLDLLKYSKHRPTREFIHMNENFDLVPCITRPTRITHSSATLIDNIFVNTEQVRELRSVILINDISDHLPTCTILENVNLGKKKKKKIFSRKITKNSLSMIKNELSAINWETHLVRNGVNMTDVDSLFNCVHSKICNSIEKHAPVKERIVYEHCIKSEPWMTAGIKCSSRKLKSMYKATLKPSATINTRETYKLYRNCLNKLKRNCKAQYYKNHCKLYKKNTKKLWEIINNSMGKLSNKNCIINSLRVENVTVTDPQDIANELCNHYSTVGKKLSSKIRTPKSHNSKISMNSKSLFMSPTTRDEILLLIDKLPSKRSSDYDNLDNVLLKQLKFEIATPLEIVFNKSLEMGIFPCLMKNAEVIPLYKNKEKDLCINYRPISLLMTMSKLLEKIVYKRTYNFLDTTGQLYSSQYGFRSKHSCENAISELIGQVVKGHERKEHTAAIFLDLSKAFDTLDHGLLLKKLELYGIRGDALGWFTSYLSNRKMRVKYCGEGESTYSNWKKVTHGTPQGSCLGPLLFLIFCNDLHQNLTYLSCIQFADDTTLYITNKNLRVLKACIEHDLSIITDWFGANSLTLNINKTSLLLFDYRKQQNNVLELNVSGNIIKSVKCTKFLGVILDDKLSWDNHLDQLRSKINQNYALLCRSKKLLNVHGMKILYHALIYSHLSYCIVLWGSMLSAESTRKLGTLQNKCVKLVDLSKTVNQIYKQYRILKIADIIDLEQKKLGHKLIHGELPKNLEKLMMTNSTGCPLKKQHQYKTRQKKLPNLPKHSSKLYNNSFLHQSLKNYNNLNDTIKNCTSIFSLAKRIKDSAIMSYNI